MIEDSVARRDAYRLTWEDEQRMSRAIRRAIADRRTHDGIVSAAANSIGCVPSDLRDVEIQWIENEIGEHEMGLR